MKKNNSTINDYVQDVPQIRGILGRFNTKYLLPIVATLGLTGLVHANDTTIDYDAAMQDASATNAVATVVLGTNDVLSATNGYASATNDYQAATNDVKEASSYSRVASKAASKAYATSIASESTYSGEKSATEANKPIAAVPINDEVKADMTNDVLRATSDSTAPVAVSSIDTNCCIAGLNLVSGGVELIGSNLTTDAYYIILRSENMLPSKPGGSNIWENIQDTFVKYTGADGGVTNWLVTPKGNPEFYRLRGVKE